LKQLDFSEFVKTKKKAHVLCNKCCSAMKKTSDSFRAKRAQIYRKNRHISANVRFMHVTNRIKSQLVGMKTMISANYACFKRTIFIFLVFLHVSGFESFGAPITNTIFAFSPAIPMAEL